MCRYAVGEIALQLNAEEMTVFFACFIGLRFAVKMLMYGTAQL